MEGAVSGKPDDVDPRGVVDLFFGNAHLALQQGVPEADVKHLEHFVDGRDVGSPCTPSAGSLSVFSLKPSQ
jgi:hypothetical protein